MTQVPALDAVQDASAEALNTVVGAGAMALDEKASDEFATRARRRGARITNRAVARAQETADTTLALPERVLHQSLRRLRKTAGRKDVVGVVSRQMLGAVNAPAGQAAGFFARIERETELPKRAVAASRAPRRQKVQATRRNVKRGVRRARRAA